MIRIGVDIGGTKMEIAAIDESGEELLRRRAAAPGGGYDEAMAAIAEFILDAERTLAARCSVGVCTPGAVSIGSGTLKNAYASVLNAMQVKPDLERLLGREVRFANDANCFALSEAIDGAALSGANAICGEWGHNSLPWPVPEEMPGPRCACGRNGCIEAFLSGPGLARDHLLATGEAREPADIVERAESGDRGCAATLERYEERLARALASVINLLDPETIVLGGGLSNTDRLYRNVPALWSRHVYSDTVVTRLVKAAHGDASGVRGAARLW